MSYLIWQEKILPESTPAQVSIAYDQGFLFGRKDKGYMYQTRSLRIDLSKFELNSENRRVLRKTEGISMQPTTLPLENYSWEIHKMGKDFYSTKFGEATMSAAKIKELFTNPEQSNFNNVFIYSQSEKALGYCLFYSNTEILHYAYPFYDLELNNSNFGMGMMIRGIEWAQQQGLKYVYLGSVDGSAAKYKLQFEGLEWFDGKDWTNDLEKLKSVLV